MKKLLVFCIVVAVVLSMSVTVFAELGSFVSSPSTNGAPTLDKDNSDEGANVVAYRDRDGSLSAEEVADLEAAYADIVGADNLVDLVPSLEEIANKLSVNVNGLAVSDLFHVELANDGEEHHLRFNAKTLGNIVSLMHFVDGHWRLVADMEVVDEETIDVVVDASGVYAVVVSTDGTPVYPQGLSTGAIIGIIAAIVVVAGAAVAAVIIIKKRKNA